MGSVIKYVFFLIGFLYGQRDGIEQTKHASNVAFAQSEAEFRKTMSEMEQLYEFRREQDRDQARTECEIMMAFKAGNK